MNNGSNVYKETNVQIANLFYNNLITCQEKTGKRYQVELSFLDIKLIHKVIHVAYRQMEHSMRAAELLGYNCKPVHQKSPKFQLRRWRSEQRTSLFFLALHIVDFGSQLRFPPFSFYHSLQGRLKGSLGTFGARKKASSAEKFPWTKELKFSFDSRPPSRIFYFTFRGNFLTAILQWRHLPRMPFTYTALPIKFTLKSEAFEMLHTF